jgi:N-acetylglucosaminyldiphosphoundecaprenol N-acetyl-beta-D-mannosaminyltransferase
MAANVCHGVGGSFDVMAGLVRRAPSWMQRTGLEWLYRIWQEPRRMWKRYLVTNAQFLVLAMGEIACRRRTRIAKPLP